MLFFKNNSCLKFCTKTDLSLKRVKKYNLALGLKNNNKRNSWFTIKEKPPFYLIFVMCRWLLGGGGGQQPPDPLK